MSVRGKLVKKTSGKDKEQLHKCKRDHELHFFGTNKGFETSKLLILYVKRSSLISQFMTPLKHIK